jgi:spermidine/putrescine-binding protein
MESDLTLLTWPDYVNPLTLGQFELEFGVMVKVEIVPSAVELVERMRARPPGGCARAARLCGARTGW